MYIYTVYKFHPHIIPSSDVDVIQCCSSCTDIRTGIITVIRGLLIGPGWRGFVGSAQGSQEEVGRVNGGQGLGRRAIFWTSVVDRKERKKKEGRVKEFKMSFCIYYVSEKETIFHKSLFLNQCTSHRHACILSHLLEFQRWQTINVTSGIFFDLTL